MGIRCIHEILSSIISQEINTQKGQSAHFLTLEWTQNQVHVSNILKIFLNEANAGKHQHFIVNRQLGNIGRGRLCKILPRL